MSERRLTTSQVAKRLGLDGDAGVRHVLRLIESGDLCAVDISTGEKRPRWRVAESEVERYIADREAEAQARAQVPDQQISRSTGKILRQERRERRWRA